MDYDPKLGFRSLRFGEKLCAAAFPIIAVVDGLIFAASACFECQKVAQREKSSYASDDLLRLSREFHFNVSEVKALYELFKKLSSSIFDDGFIHKEEFQLALFRTEYGKNLFFDWVFDIFDQKRQGVIDLEEFVLSMSVFHPNAPVEEKIEFTFRLYDLRQTGFIERVVLKQMVISILTESDMKISDELLDQIIEKTFVDADADEDGRISKEDREAFIKRYPPLLRNMTLPYLKCFHAKQL